MNEYEYKTTNLIADYFDENCVPYRVCKRGEIEEVVVEFRVESGPSMQIHYVNGDDDNDLAVLLKLINKVPSDKRIQMLEACNTLNKKKNHVCFFLNDDNDILISYDFLLSMTDESIGAAAHEILLRAKFVLDDHYRELMKALYQPKSEVDVKFDNAFMKLLSGINFQKENNKDNNALHDNDENNE